MDIKERDQITTIVDTKKGKYQWSINCLIC